MLELLNRLKMAGLLAVLAWNVSALKVSANGFGLPDQDAFATARGEAFVATADNASAIYYNPAGITQLTNSNFRGGVYGVYFQPSYTPPNSAPNHGHTYDSSDNFAAIPQFFFTYRTKNSPFSFGLGVYAPYGGNMSWPQDTGFRSVALSGSLKYITINPVVALKILPSLSLGGGVMVNYAKLSLYQGLLPTATPKTNFFNFRGDGWSAGYNVGLLWQPVEIISFGATFRSSANMHFQGNTDFQLQPRPYYNRAQREAAAEFTFPLTTVVGVSYRPTPKWNLEVDANYTGWNSFGTTSIEQSPPPVKNPFQQNIPVKLGWQDSWMYEFGVTRYFDHGWHVSGAMSSMKTRCRTSITRRWRQTWTGISSAWAPVTRGGRLILMSPINSATAPRTRSPAALRPPRRDQMPASPPTVNTASTARRSSCRWGCIFDGRQLTVCRGRCAGIASRGLFQPKTNSCHE